MNKGWGRFRSRLPATKNDLKETKEELMANLNDLKTKVTRLTTVTSSVITLLTDIKRRLDEALADDDVEAIRDLSESIGRDTDALAAAVVAKTPGANPPYPEQPFD